MENNELENEKSHRRYSVWKQILDNIQIAICVLAVIFLAIWGKLNAEATSALIGTIIGYSLGELKKRVSN